MGLFSSKNKKQKQKNKELNQDTVGTANQETPKSTVYLQKYVAKESFTARSPLELEFEKGDKLEFISDHGEGWFKARVTRSGKEVSGFVHESYVASVDSLDAFEWYHGDISRDKAITMLMNSTLPAGTFLVRSSSKGIGYVISLKVIKNEGEAVRNYQIIVEGTEELTYRINNRLSFDTVEKLIDAYKPHGNAHSSTIILRFSCPKSIDTVEPVEIKDKWEIERNKIVLGKKIGSGSFGTVYVGKWKNTMEIAVKILKEDTMDKSEFHREAAIMKKLKHPNILPLIGVCSTSEPMLMVTELMSHGNLLTVLRSEKINFHDQIYVIAQIACGMKYAETKRLIHRDLAARNVLVKDNLVCKIADFGMARLLKDSVYSPSAGCVFPYKWSPPEVLLNQEFSTKSDVWAFGIVCIEVFTNGAEIYKEYSSVDICRLVPQGLKPHSPQNCSEKLYDKLKETWYIDSEKRPSFEHLYDFFSNYQVTIQEQYDVDF